MTELYLQFKDETTYNRIAQDIAVTLNDGIKFYASKPTPDFDIDGGPNIIGHAVDATGKVCVGHPFSTEDEVWLEIYLADEITAGNVSLHDIWPEDWQYPGGDL